MQSAEGALRPLPSDDKLADWLLQPVTPATFAATYWDRQPLHISARGRSYYDPVFGLSDLDQSLNRLSARPPYVRVVKDGRELPLHALSGRSAHQISPLEEVFAHYREGATIVAQFLHEHDPHLRTFCRALSQTWSVRMQVNAYMTPGSEKGLARHYDTHDIFVLQLFGRKAWTLFERMPLSPFSGEQAAQDQLEHMTPSQELVLEPGDLLYLPRGLVHTAEGLGEGSLHLAVGAHPMRWAQIIQSCLTEHLSGQAQLRESLPLGYANAPGASDQLAARFKDVWKDVERAITPQQLAERALDAARGLEAPDLSGHLTDLVALDQLDHTSKLILRPDLSVETRCTAEEVSLVFLDKTVTVPAALEGPIRVILTKGAFAVDDLPDPLSRADKLTLCRKLLKEGLLTMAGRSAPDRAGS